VRYEFFYEPGFTHVHPALGHLAILLEENDVKLHRMAKANDPAQPLPIDPSNAIAEPESRRGQGKLPLVKGDWNAVELRIARDQLMVTLNGHLIFERPIEPNNDRRFGFFRYKAQTAARIRNVVLSGDWPASLPTDDILAAEITSP